MKTKTRRKIALVGGARPNFMKIAPIYHVLKEKNMPFFLLNTGQHFDEKMSKQFFREFKIAPHYNITPSTTTPISQLTSMMLEIEKIFTKEKPAIVVVVGDVNSTFVAAYVAHKMKIPVAHVEAGLRSRNREMPEEINRILVDQISDLLFVTEKEGIKNLKKENIAGEVHFVGNIMMDTLALFADSIKPTDNDFYFCTLHRAENVDHQEIFAEILDALEVISKDAPIFLPLHPRTAKKAEEFGLMTRLKNIFRLLEPLAYSEAVYYQKNAKLVLTDSGGIQEETTFLGTPCITLRKETERPITVHLGTNTIGGVKKSTILKAYRTKDLKKKKVKIQLWDGRTANRIATVLHKYVK